jgi:phage terminase Nu1 subunit (DNA packaging protein)
MADEAPEPMVPVGTIATMIDMTPRQVQNLARDGVIPKAERGRYPLISSVQGYVRHQRRQISQGSKKLGEDARLKAAQADLRELELSRARSELYDANAVDAVLIEAVMINKTSLDALPSRSSVDLANKAVPEIKRILQDEVSAIHNEFAGRLAKVGRSLLRIKRIRAGAKKEKA